MVNLIKEYFEKRIELLKLNASEKIFNTIGAAAPFVAIFVLLLFLLLLLNIGIGLLIGELLQNYAYGFLLLAVFYFLLILLIYLFRNRIKSLIVNKAINNFYNK